MSRPATEIEDQAFASVASPQATDDGRSGESQGKGGFNASLVCIDKEMDQLVLLSVQEFRVSTQLNYFDLK
jgi:hypothetical protein